MSLAAYIPLQRQLQAAFFRGTVGANSVLPRTHYCLTPDHRALNLHPLIREEALAYFGPPRNIAWHQHAASGLSSQVMCVNFLMPLAHRPDLLKEVIARALNRPVERMLPVEDGPHYVGFEWTGRRDYLGEWGKSGTATRGANVTSADAVVRFEAQGRAETLLIEWKYTESYGKPPEARREAERIRRYRDKAFHPDGPIRADMALKVQDLFWEPVYQMFRQQMLAFRMQHEREDGAERVSVLHISPAGNTDLHRVTPPRLKQVGQDVFAVFRSLLVSPDDFTATTVEHAFAPMLHAHQSEPWAAYLLDRYGLASSERSSDAQEAH